MTETFIERNGVTAKFTLNSIERGRSKGTQYLCIDESIAKDDLQTFLGPKETWDILWQAVKTICLGIHRQATDGEGVFSLELFKKGIKELEERTESREKLLEKRNVLIKKLQDLTNQEVSVNLLTEMRQVSAEISALDILIARRRKSREEIEDDDEPEAAVEKK
jgi:hypothetical protein